ncbi:MAG: hypothetical protein H6Q04_584 [Acidobacteria bacterium]|nr:hypothetical protein [Acidobacteriota bacterium]
MCTHRKETCVNACPNIVMLTMMKKFAVVFLITLFAIAGSGSLAAQTNGQNSSEIQAVPNRPTFSTTAETVYRGVFEIEYGVDLASGKQDLNGLLKFGLTKNLEIRFGNITFVRDGGIAGFGDSGAGFKFRFLKDKGAWPTLAVLYTLTVPSASEELGSGALGHSAGLLVSKDFGKHHLDFNESIQFLGRGHAEGFDRNYFTAISYSHPITQKLAISEEVAGYSRTNETVGATLTVLQALSYSVSPRLVIDGGCYIAAMGDLPRATFVAGVTYAIGDLYRRLRRHYP